MTIIELFLKKYEKEQKFYQQLATLANDILEKEIFNRGIKALVSNRVKRVESLKEKLYRRNERKHYKSLAEIESDIRDLAGVRVALYFPSDREMLGRVIEELFDVKYRKEFPTMYQKPVFNKRFSGYWATHYRVHVRRQEGIGERFTSKMVEIQVASVLMHAWAEVEHDLVYKPVSGKVSEEELAILDEINGLVIAGEIALERLQKAYSERTRRKKEITDRYELSLLVLNNFKNLDLSGTDLGDTGLLNNYLKTVKKMDTAEILESFEKVNLNFQETITDQILSDIITKNYNKNLRKYLASFTPDKDKVAAYELFLKTWFLFEEVVFVLSKEYRKPMVPDFFLREGEYGFDDQEVEMLKELRLLRNKLLHGHNTLTRADLAPSHDRLRVITLRTIKRIRNEKKRNKFFQVLDAMRKPG